MLYALRSMRNSVRSFWEREPVLVLAMFFGFTGKCVHLSQNIRIHHVDLGFSFVLLGPGIRRMDERLKTWPSHYRS